MRARVNGFASWPSSVAVVLLSLTMSVVPGRAQGPYVAFFSAPSYPPIARQAMISGRVTLDIQIEKNGAIKQIRDRYSDNPLLLEASRVCVSEWKFHESKYGHDASITFFYSFSGRVAEVNPKTTVRADFPGASLRVFVVTDAFPVLPPDRVVREP